jgi:hypothetical protein
MDDPQRQGEAPSGTAGPADATSQFRRARPREKLRDGLSAELSTEEVKYAGRSGDRLKKLLR